MNKPNKGFLSSCRNGTLVNLVDNNHSKFRFYGRITHQQCMLLTEVPKQAIPHTRLKANRALYSPAVTLSKPRRRRQWKRGKPKAFNGKNNSCARAFYGLLHSFTVLCKPARWNHQIFRGLRTEPEDEILFFFFFLIHRCLQMLCWGYIRVVDKWHHCRDAKPIIPFEKFIRKLWIYFVFRELS